MLQGRKSGGGQGRLGWSPGMELTGTLCLGGHCWNVLFSEHVWALTASEAMLPTWAVDGS